MTTNIQQHMGTEQLSTDMENHVPEEKIVKTPPTPTRRKLRINMRSNASYFVNSNVRHLGKCHIRYFESLKDRMETGKCTIEIKVLTNSQSDCEYSLDVLVLDRMDLGALVFDKKALDALLSKSKDRDAFPFDSRLGVLSGLNYKNVHTLGLNFSNKKCQPYAPVLLQFPNVDTLLFESVDYNDMIFILNLFHSLESIFIYGCDLTPCQLSEIFKYCTGKEIHISANYVEYTPIEPNSILPSAELKLLPKLEILSLKYDGPMIINPEDAPNVKKISIESPAGGNIQFVPFIIPSLVEFSVDGNLNSQLLENSLPNVKELHVNGLGCCQAFGSSEEDVRAETLKFNFLPVKCLRKLSVKYIEETISCEIACADWWLVAKFVRIDYLSNIECDSATFQFNPHQGPIVLSYRHGIQPTATKLMSMSTTVPDYTISTSAEQYYPKKIHDLLLVARIYNIATERLVTEFKFLKDLHNILFQARTSMMLSRRPIVCSNWINELKIDIKANTTAEITNEMDSLQQLMEQNNSFGTKLQNENCRVKSVIHDYKLGKDENLLQSGYLETIKTIESTLKGNEIQKFWSSYLQSPVVWKYFRTELQRSESFSECFVAIFNMVVFLNKDCNSPYIWSFHKKMEELMNDFQSFLTVGV